MKTHNFRICNLDTDSISFTKPDGAPFTEEEQEALLLDLNSNYPPMIRWDHDGIYPAMVILKAKNYIIYNGKKLKLKGSALRSSKTEPKLKAFIDEIAPCLVFDQQDKILSIYHKYIYEIFNLTDISAWSSKKTITAAVLEAKRTTEAKILAAVNGRSIQMGEKYYMYFTMDGSLKLRENWDKDHDPKVLLTKLYKTLLIFQNVINIDNYPKYHLVKNKEKLKNILDNPSIA